jgi:hypothetical protein
MVPPDGHQCSHNSSEPKRNYSQNKIPISTKEKLPRAVNVNIAIAYQIRTASVLNVTVVSKNILAACLLAFPSKILFKLNFPGCSSDEGEGT